MKPFVFRRTWWQRWRWSRVKRRAYHSRLGWWLRERLPDSNWCKRP